MKKGFLALLVALGMMVLLAGGCANKEVVRSEEMFTPKEDAAKVVPRYEPTKPSEIVEPSVSTENRQTGETPAVYSFQTIYFDFDKSDLRQDARDMLNKNAGLLKSSSSAKVQIEGHCDERGSLEYNLALGERRARSAMQYLITLGVKADRLSIISYGKEKPAVQGSSEEAWAKNRRAEFVNVR